MRLAVVLFQLLPGGITWLSAKISPSKNFAYYSILTISVLLGISKIINYRTMTGVYEDNFRVFFAILLTCLTIGFDVSLSVGAGIEMFEEKEENFKRKGLMTEAVSAIISYGFNKLELHRIEALIGSSNIPSLRILEKHNFIREGLLRQHYFVSEKFEDSILFSKLYNEYQTELKNKTTNR